EFIRLIDRLAIHFFVLLARLDPRSLDKFRRRRKQAILLLRGHDGLLGHDRKPPGLWRKRMVMVTRVARQWEIETPPWAFGSSRSTSSSTRPSLRLARSLPS